MKPGGGQGEAYELIDIPSSGTTPAADPEGTYETPSAPSQPLPSTPLPSEAKDEEEEEEGVYEAIPGDK